MYVLFPVVLLLASAVQQSPQQTAAPKPVSTDWAGASREALELNRPLIVWIGGNFCDRCVRDSKNEFVHLFVDSGWGGNRGPATAIYVPQSDGYLYRIATVTRWTVGSHDWGHIPSARRLVHEWTRRAAQGSTAPLPLLQLDGSWGWPADRSSLPGSSSPAPVRLAPRAGC